MGDRLMWGPMGDFGGYGMGGYALWGGLMMVVFWGRCYRGDSGSCTLVGE